MHICGFFFLLAIENLPAMNIQIKLPVLVSIFNSFIFFSLILKDKVQDQGEMEAPKPERIINRRDAGKKSTKQRKDNKRAHGTLRELLTAWDAYGGILKENV